jgi:hypothetical protein
VKDPRAERVKADGDVNRRFKMYALVAGVALIFVSAFAILAALRGGARAPRTVAALRLPTRAATAPPRTPAPSPTPSASPRPTYAPLRRVPVRTFPPSPSPTPSARPAHSPTPTPRPTPTASHEPTPHPTPSNGPSAVARAGGADDPECLRSMDYLKTAADDRIGRLEAYNATVAGLAMNAHCREPRRSVNEGYLLAMRAPAEFALRVGDWNADLTRSDALLDACAASTEFRGTTVARDCATQRAYNGIARRRILQAISRRPPTPAPR